MFCRREKTQGGEGGGEGVEIKLSSHSIPVAPPGRKGRRRHYLRFRLSIPPPPNPLSFLLLLLGDFLLVIMQTDRQTLHSHTILVFSLPSQPHFPPTIRGAVKHLFLSPFLFSLLGFSFPSTCSRRTDGWNINPKGKTTHSTQRGRTIPSIPLLENRAPHTKGSKKLPGFFLGGGGECPSVFSIVNEGAFSFPSFSYCACSYKSRGGGGNWNVR